MTPHIEAKKKDIASTVLMPGDPLRAKYIAKKFLKKVKLVNKVRNMFMYTGYYKGQRVTIAGSGMGQPSIGIYSYELFKFYDVKRIIRIGSAGSYKKDLKLYDVVLASEAYSSSTAFAKAMLNKNVSVVPANKKLNKKIVDTAKELNIPLTVGRVHSSDIFYSKIPLKQIITTTNAICVEMESAALFVNAMQTKKEAACLLTISDNLITKEETSAKERQKAFKEMMILALEVAIK